MRDTRLNVVMAGMWPVVLSEVVLEAGGKRLIDGVSLRLEPGSLTCVMGPNGAGKSLLLRLIAGLIQPSSGRVSYGGAPSDQTGGAGRSHIAFVFQRPVLLRRSVAANLDHALKTYGVARAERPGRIAELLALGQLEGLAGRPARVLSGGEQQRLSMVRALAARPDLLLLDEPAASLDPQATAAVEALIRAAVAKRVKVVLVTHDRDQARRMADDVVFLHHGRIAERGDADTFFDQPQSSEAQAYLAGRLLL
ncbi:MAG TPA: ATP-binding cassette domain-containing protein [Thermohalobaculum sp.]|nr:ATP-binding cassette domain-containing protein [Thermohalobaculum sp.]